LAGGDLGPCLFKQRGEFLPSFWVSLKPDVDCGRVNDQALTPLLCGMHQRGFCAVQLTIALNDLPDSLMIGLAHQPADELHLSTPALVGADAACEPDRIDHALGDGELQQSLVGQSNQLFAEVLQRMAVALALGFAGRGA
jgi:hypothetical protein